MASIYLRFGIGVVSYTRQLWQQELSEDLQSSCFYPVSPTLNVNSNEDNELPRKVNYNPTLDIAAKGLYEKGNVILEKW